MKEGKKQVHLQIMIVIRENGMGKEREAMISQPQTVKQQEQAIAILAAAAYPLISY
jgi:hypothetical protein